MTTDPNATDPEDFAAHASEAPEDSAAQGSEVPEDPTPRASEVQVVLWDGVELLDFAGPGQVFACADEGRAFRVRTVAARAGAIRSQGFLTVEPEGVLGELPPPRILVVPGGSSETALADEELIGRVRRVGAEAEIVFSVCTGALILARAGLLVDGMGATTWHGALDRLRTAAPGVGVVEGPRWVDNGSVITAAGVSAGIDAALHLVARLLGSSVMQETARYMEYGSAGFYGTGSGIPGGEEILDDRGAAGP